MPLFLEEIQNRGESISNGFVLSHREIVTLRMADRPFQSVQLPDSFFQGTAEPIQRLPSFFFGRVHDLFLTIRGQRDGEKMFVYPGAGNVNQDSVPPLAPPIKMWNPLEGWGVMGVRTRKTTASHRCP